MILRHSFEPPDNQRLAHLCGSLDENLRSLEAALDVSISRRNEFFRVEGAKPRAERAMALLQTLYEQAARAISAEQLQLVMADTTGADSPNQLALRTRRPDLAGRTPNQLT